MNYGIDRGVALLILHPESPGGGSGCSCLGAGPERCEIGTSGLACLDCKLGLLEHGTLDFLLWHVPYLDPVRRGSEVDYLGFEVVNSVSYDDSEDSALGYLPYLGSDLCSEIDSVVFDLEGLGYSGSVCLGVNSGICEFAFEGQKSVVPGSRRSVSVRSWNYCLRIGT